MKTLWHHTKINRNVTISVDNVAMMNQNIKQQIDDLKPCTFGFTANRNVAISC